MSRESSGWKGGRRRVGEYSSGNKDRRDKYGGFLSPLQPKDPNPTVNPLNLQALTASLILLPWAESLDFKGSLSDHTLFPQWGVLVSKSSILWLSRSGHPLGTLPISPTSIPPTWLCRSIISIVHRRGTALVLSLYCLARRIRILTRPFKGEGMGGGVGGGIVHSALYSLCTLSEDMVVTTWQTSTGIIRSKRTLKGLVDGFFTSETLLSDPVSWLGVNIWRGEGEEFIAIWGEGMGQWVVALFWGKGIGIRIACVERVGVWMQRIDRAEIIGQGKGGDKVLAVAGDGKCVLFRIRPGGDLGGLNDDYAKPCCSMDYLLTVNL